LEDVSQGEEYDAERSEDGELDLEVDEHDFAKEAGGKRKLGKQWQ
jgi:hypothetical protein